MELSQLGFLEELLAAPRKDTTWSSSSSSSSALSTTAFTDLLFPNASWSFDPFASSSSFEAPYPFSDDAFTMPDLDSSFPPPPPPPPPPPLPEEEEEDKNGGFLCNGEEEEEEEEEEERKGFCKVEEKKAKSKKVEGQPSKNLMAERRRRKRLNDRLSMLRSIVPKISKMDRTSILGDTIDYMKELLERISKLQYEEDTTSQMINLLGIPKEIKPNEAMVRNSPKFDVERREQDTRISICCAAKPGLLLSTVNTLEAIGLEIQQCVISSFNDFSMQASCSEVAEQRNCIGPEEMKQALFRSAGYGGRCL